MDWPEAVVAIIIIVTIGRVMRSKYRAQHGIAVPANCKTKLKNYVTVNPVRKVEGQA